MTDLISTTFQSLLDPTMPQASIVAESIDPSSSVATFVVRQFNDDAGGEVLIQEKPGQSPQIIKSDSTLYPVDPGLVGDRVAADLNRQLGDDGLATAQSFEQFTNSNFPSTNDELNEQIVQMAIMLDGQLPSDRVPHTGHGALACAWAVNEIAKRILGRPIGGGLSTDKMFDVLEKYHLPVTDQSQISGGNLIISPSAGKIHGHVGIVGNIVPNLPKTIIYSNSTSLKKWYHSYNIEKWYNYYTSKEKGLDVFFFQIDITKFQAGT